MSNSLDVLYEAIANRNSDHFSSDDRWLEFLDMMSTNADLIAAVLRAADAHSPNHSTIRDRVDALKAAVARDEQP